MSSQKIITCTLTLGPGIFRQGFPFRKILLLRTLLPAENGVSIEKQHGKYHHRYSDAHTAVRNIERGKPRYTYKISYVTVKKTGGIHCSVYSVSYGTGKQQCHTEGPPHGLLTSQKKYINKNRHAYYGKKEKQDVFIFPICQHPERRAIILYENKIHKVSQKWYYFIFSYIVFTNIFCHLIQDQRGYKHSSYYYIKSLFILLIYTHKRVVVIYIFSHRKTLCLSSPY